MTIDLHITARCLCRECQCLHEVETTLDGVDLDEPGLRTAIREKIEEEQDATGWHGDHCPEHAAAIREMEHRERMADERRELED